MSRTADTPLGHMLLPAWLSGREGRVHHLLVTFQLAVGVGAVLLAALVLVGGWIAGIDALKSVMPGLATMKVNTATGIGTLGAALVLTAARPSRRSLRDVLACVAVIVGLVTVAEYAFHWDAHIDQLWIRDVATPPDAAPGRPAAATAAMIALLGLALLCVGRPALGVQKSLAAAAAALIAWLTVTGYVFGPPALQEVALFRSVALHTAVIMLLLAVAVLTTEPVSRLVRTALSAGAAGVMCRGLLPPAIFMPPLLGWLLSREGVWDFFPLPFDWAAYSCLSTLGSVWLIAVLSGRILTIDAQRGAATELSAQLRQALNEREFFKAVIENSSDFIGIADAGGTPVYLNPAGRRMVGLDPDFPIGTLQVSDCYPAELREFVNQVILRRMQETGRWQGETLFRNFASNESIPVSDTHFVVRESGTDRVIGSATITRDISEAKRARQDLEAANRRLEDANQRLRRSTEEQQLLVDAGAIFGSTLDYGETLMGVARLVVRGYADQCMVSVVEESGGMRRVAAVARDPSLQWACDIVTRAPIDEARPHVLAETLRTAQPVLIRRFSDEMLDSFAQGNPDRLRALRGLGPKSAIVVPLIARGKLLGAMAFISSDAGRLFGADDLHLAEAIAMRAALSIDNARLYEAARQAVSARDEVLGVVAHDLRNPLNAIVLNSEMIQNQPTDAGGATESAVAIRHSAMRMNRLIEDLLDIARLDAGRLALDVARVSIRRILEDSVRSQQALAAERSIELRLEAPADIGEMWADRDRTVQVFENLVSNAIKFTQPGGRVTIAASSAEGEILFSVSDTGEGMDPEDLPHIFDRFWQAHKRERRRGTGLGLAIVKGIVEAHAGRVWAISQPGRGSTFYFTIPKVRQPGSGFGGAGAGQARART